VPVPDARAQLEVVLDGADATSVEVVFTHADHLGSGHILTDGAGALLSQEEYFPYGRSSDRRDERNRYRYIGVERDEDTGLLMTGPRTYDPVTGRFLQGDPLASTEYAAFSPFQYSRGNPVGRSDGNGYGDLAGGFDLGSDVNVDKALESAQTPGDAIEAGLAEAPQAVTRPSQATSSPEATHDAFYSKFHTYIHGPKHEIKFVPHSDRQELREERAKEQTVQKWNLPDGEYEILFSDEESKAERLSHVKEGLAAYHHSTDAGTGEIHYVSGRPGTSRERLAHEVAHEYITPSFSAYVARNGGRDAGLLIEGVATYLGNQFIGVDTEVDGLDSTYTDALHFVTQTLDTGAASEDELLDASLGTDQIPRLQPDSCYKFGARVRAPLGAWWTTGLSRRHLGGVSRDQAAAAKASPGGNPSSDSQSSTFTPVTAS